jgi:HEAT repeat protein
MVETDLEVQEVPEGELTLVRDILRSLTKTIKTFSAYPKGNPIYQKFADEIAGKFAAFFEAQETLDLKVDQFSLVYKGHEVFTSEERSANIALYLFIDGIRQISFHKGLSIDEIADFINIVRDAQKEKTEDDLVTLLWDRDFEDISYFVPEELAGDEAMAEEQLISQIESTTQTQAAEGAKGGSPSPAGAKGHPALAVGRVSLSQLVAAPGDGDREALISESANLKGDSLLSSAIDLFFELMVDEEDISVFSEFCKNIGSAITLRLELNNAAGVIDILRRLNGLLGSVESAEKRQGIGRIIGKAGSAENISAVMKSSDHKVVGEYLSLLNMDAVSPVIQILGNTEDRKLRSMLCGFLVPFVKEDVAPFASALSDERWYLVRNILMVLGHSGASVAVSPIRRVLRHPDLKVRKEAARALAMIPHPEAKRPLMALLNDQDGEIRTTALKALRRFGGEDLFLSLMEAVLQDGFKKKDFNEKKEFFEALGENGKEKALPVLERFFRKKSLFAGNEVNELKACSAFGLGLIGTPEAMSLLREGAASKNDMLRSACLRAMKGKP